MISPIRFDYINKHVDGLEYIMRYIQLKKVGTLFQGRCPFHNEKTGSFTVYPPGYQGQEHTSFYCFGCEAGGDIVEFKRRQENVSRTEALVLLEKEYGIEAEDEELQHELLVEQLQVIKHAEDNPLDLSEINLLISSLCRNYLKWVKENFAEQHQTEIWVLEQFYRYLDKALLESSAVEAMALIEDTKQRLNKRRTLLLREEL